jgi:hypothetical protein
LKPNTLRLRTQLLRETLDLAAERSPFYRERIGGIAGRVRSLEDLALLPTTTKSDLARHSRQMLTMSEFPARMGLSSGTSYLYGADPPAVCYQSEADVRMHNEMLELLRPPPDAVAPLAALIYVATHGGPFGSPPPGCFLLLTTEFSFTGYSSRLESLCGSLNIVKLIATLLTHGGGPVPYPSSLRAVFTYGFHLTRRWRSFIETSLGAPVTDMYGISEIVGATCSECPACRAFHLPPIVIPEILHPRDDAVAVHRDVGELVVTSLAPFQTMQPLLRYRTGDLVQIAGVCEVSGEVAFRPLGRVVKSVWLDEFGAVLPSGLVYEAIDDLASVARTPYRLLPNFGVGPLFGTPNFRMRGLDTENAVLEIEMNVLPAHFPDEMAALSNSLRARLLNLTEAGAAAARGGRFDVQVEFLPPGSLRDPFEMFH